MIIVLVKYVCKRGLRERFLHEIQNRKIDVLSREEKGNSRYEYSNSILDDDTLILTELWSDEEAVKNHAETEHFKALGAIKAEYVESIEISRFLGTEITN